MTALALLLQLVVLGLHVLAPWHLARIAGLPQASQASPEAPDRRRIWALVATPLLLAAGLAGLYTVLARLDAALAWGLSWPPTSVPALALLFAATATGLTDLVLFVGHRKLEPSGWRLAAGLGGALLLAASVAGELLRLGRSPATGLVGLAIAALCRVMLSLAAGESAWGPVRGFSTLAGATLPLTLLGLAPAVRAALGLDLATLGAASILLLAARFLPPPLRRPAAFAGVLLAALFLDRTGDLAAGFEPAGSLPDLFLPEP